jgi:hypothetical protein
MWSVMIWSSLICFIQAVSYDGLLYTNDKNDVDCFLYIYRYFCRSTGDTFLPGTINNVCVGGNILSFSILKQSKVTTNVLINWLIPFDLIEQYAEYLSRSDINAEGNLTICKCTQNQIGRYCEYELTREELDISYTIRKQRSRDSASSETATSFIDEMTCNAGALNLEWRQVCDGIVNCQDAADEFNCHLLELNKCNTDEFQCRSGMCIPKEFLYDITFDCMDLSDEQELDEIYAIFDKCSTESIIDCDERLCRKDQFSCGDGRCVSWSAVINQQNGCDSSRHVAYICETVDSLVNSRGASIGICEQTTPYLPPLTETSSCTISLRHLLHAEQSKLSNKIREISINNIINHCPELIQYPEQAILSPVLKMFYNKSMIETFYQNRQNLNRQMPRRAHLYCLNGSMMCDEVWMTLQNDSCFSYQGFQNLTFYPYFPISHLFCQIAAEQGSLKRLVLERSFLILCFFFLATPY